MINKIKSTKRNQRILIVDDEPSLLSALVDKFTRAGFTALVAKDGKEGLHSAFKNHPDLILLDIIMPVMDGVAMMHELRKDPWGKNASIIILTSYDTNDSQLFQITTDSPSYYLVKSNTSIDRVLEKVKEILDSKKA